MIWSYIPILIEHNVYINTRSTQKNIERKQTNKNVKLTQGKRTTNNEFNEYTNIREYKNSMCTETQTVQKQKGTETGLRQRIEQKC